MRRFLPALLILAVLLVPGCGSKSQPQPQPVFEQYIAAIQQGDFETAKTLVTADFADSMTPNMKDVAEPAVKAWLAKIQVSNIQTETKGNEATVTFDISAPDLGVIVRTVTLEMYQYALSPQFQKDKSPVEQKQQKLSEMTVEKLLAMIEDPEVAQSHQSGTATLVKEKDGWKISSINVEWKFNTASAN
ncbi:MAG TPA: hypothetical protein VIL07_01805 [Symbiobacteriaceae bacterium]